jgi:hypothetical protein
VGSSAVGEPPALRRAAWCRPTPSGESDGARERRSVQEAVHHFLCNSAANEDIESEKKEAAFIPRRPVRIRLERDLRGGWRRTPSRYVGRLFGSYGCVKTVRIRRGIALGGPQIVRARAPYGASSWSGSVHFCRRWSCTCGRNRTEAARHGPLAGAEALSYRRRGVPERARRRRCALRRGGKPVCTADTPVGMRRCRYSCRHRIPTGMSAVRSGTTGFLTSNYVGVIRAYPRDRRGR